MNGVNTPKQEKRKRRDQKNPQDALQAAPQVSQFDDSTKPVLTVKVTVDRPADAVWHCFTSPEHILHWNFASEDWHCPAASSTLEPGGAFSYRMAAKDGSAAFDFEGTFDVVAPNHQLAYTIGDRRVVVDFVDRGTFTEVIEVFEAESQNSLELQQQGWQAILDNFKKHAESCPLDA
ncbi:SRPBCC domain-containing protein [Acidaminobacter hydrogenoformans]|uniref:Uncharacterized conserved protein YndB, AHSA1/START domain n=1 Tax=Acidaminobacter hydrogenoformans DSM 2784 TaxID=1120920 RepID=A0A1G5S6H3_9FIRM|nr:SRPBCC domain-containing protein [Acidaminobacter hydrogenoformans]SCZ81808.1 Uncharacterized conserved protein YndB, AHSA1/START domain [Acidaminobacter hydrogenoformans DSM 2784]